MKFTLEFDQKKRFQPFLIFFCPFLPDDIIELLVFALTLICDSKKFDISNTDLLSMSEYVTVMACTLSLSSDRSKS